jgi:membrane-bound lytic murein transglycosylase MltF
VAERALELSSVEGSKFGSVCEDLLTMREELATWCARVAWAVGLMAVGCSTPAPVMPADSAGPATEPRKAIPAAALEPALTERETASVTTAATGDFDEMASRGVIRVLVSPGQTDYFVSDGRHSGAAVDAGRSFESFVRAAGGNAAGRVRIVFVPVPPEQRLSALTQGRGDLIAGRLAKTYEREELVMFSDPVWSDVREVLVTGPGVSPIVSLEDVAGRSIHVASGSDHFASLTRLNGQLARINKPVCKIVAMDRSLTDEDLLRMVHERQVPVTLVDHYMAEAWRPAFNAIVVNPDVAVSQDGAFAWAVRKDSPKLLALVNEFIRTHDLQGLDARAVETWKAKQ